MPETTVVVGGGLAGISAALRLADRGHQVTLLERRPRLGGRAFSFTRDGLQIDNGQHVFLRCCSAYRWLLERLDVTGETVLQERLDIPVLSPDGRSAHLTRSRGVPAPAHLGAALLRYRLLGLADRAGLGRAALALRRLDPADRGLDERTLGDFLRAHGQSDRAIDALWGIIATATLNIGPDEASLALAAKVFRTGLLDSAPAGDVGYAAVPLGRLHDDAAAKALADAGVDVRLNHVARRIEPGLVEVEGPQHGTSTLRPSAIVLATPHPEAFIAAPTLAGSQASAAAGLGTSPIVNVHVVYDRRVTDLEFAAAVGSPVQWFFDRSASSGLAARSPLAQYLAITVSAADTTVTENNAKLTGRFVDELAALLPAARGAEVLDSFVTRESQATFRQSAGSWPLRPGATDGPDGIWLAGAWTDTGWPDTMESAVRSGITAAEAAAGVSSGERLELAL
ncbi:hydroxysqualene dehydroxylase HpnE [Jatrophihabitans sp.]|uniref:hydroxysqualene dehydroxylase HpnE n=1 Tax=Jatrophihabitans sp. TaxID=1932789 RepID=UPI0030C66A77|nr:phytoene dehydrogenase [Jatrophihabitans sp.]